MQSELAGHSGMAARFFCRVCWVSAGEMDEENITDMDEDDARLEGSNTSNDSAATDQTRSDVPQEKRHIKGSEDWEDVIKRIQRFMRASDTTTVFFPATNST